MSLRKHGFTLVELLTVITIIGLLVALLLPAINSARETGRQTKCMNNQKEIGRAILHYETDRGRLPGYINPALPPSGTQPCVVSWPMSLLPFIGRKDIWDTAEVKSGSWPKDSSGSNLLMPKIPVFLCPDDPVQPTPDKGMSYVVNLKYFVDRYTYPNNSVSLSQVPNQGQTVMLGERTDDTISSPAPAGKWFLPKSAGTPGTDITFTWPTDLATAPSPSAIVPNFFTTKHAQIVVLTFFDGHCDKVLQDTLWNDTNVFGQ